MADIAETIQDTADNPAVVTADGVSMTNRPIQDLIAADRYAKASAAVKNRSGKSGLRFTKFVGPAQCPVQPVSPSEDMNGDGSFA
jgi:hypothetical protein